MANMMDRPALRTVTLDDKWTVDTGRILINGSQAIARAMLAQKMLDERKGLNTGGFISGYRGSPLGGVDSALWKVGDRLAAADVHFQPGVNEDLAATACRGTQQIDALDDATHDGVFAAWYGKGPGVDRSGDALKHGNYAGAHRNGGVVAFYGDDHAGKSSTIAHSSEQAMAANYIPSLYPADAGEILHYALLGFALSRYSGCWVGIKCVNDTVEQTITTDLDLERFSTVEPQQDHLPPQGVNYRNTVLTPLLDQQILVDHRLPLIHKFIRANGIDRSIFRGAAPRIGIITAGKSYGDVRSALELLGLDDERAAELGLSLYKVGAIWPLEPFGLAEFANEHELLIVVEEKASFIEAQAAALLINQADRPKIIGKHDLGGRPLLPAASPHEPAKIAIVIVDHLERLGIGSAELGTTRERLEKMLSATTAPAQTPDVRAPFFCSGCPHSRSTRIPDGSNAFGGIGCHSMVHRERPAETRAPVHMGAEGANWIGLAPFSRSGHIFQNMGDGTYYHSGLLAIRATVAAGVNITFKILYNDAVAMTGGQPVDGPISVAEIAHQVRHEGVKRIVVLSDDPRRHSAADLPDNVRIGHRDELDRVQRELRDVSGCSVLIYEQTCAAEKRRRRKRNDFPDPPKRMVIAETVCEGCGDCSDQSTCVSIAPTETDFGTKRQIDQSSCNKDYSCNEGFCPSFLTITDAEPRKPDSAVLPPDIFDRLPEPTTASGEQQSYNLLLAGIGGTGVITAAAILGMAGHLEGKSISLFDMTGLAQKNGAVYSHVRIAASSDRMAAQRLGPGEADLVLAFDLVAALASESSLTVNTDRTFVIGNASVSATAAFQFDRSAKIDERLLVKRMQRLAGEQSVHVLDAQSISQAVIGNSLAANIILLGFAAQSGRLPLSVAAIEQAIRLNGASVDANIRAFRLGRLSATDPARLASLLPQRHAPKPMTVDQLIDHRAGHLTAYQNAAYAARYRSLVERFRSAELAVAPDSQMLARTVAAGYANLLAYKDEYEVARLLSDPAMIAEVRSKFEDGARITFNLAPPFLPGRAPNGRPRKRSFNATWLLPMLRLLARMRGLRGSRFDPFGHTADRRLERRLIDEYESLAEQVVDDLTAANLGAAISLLGAIDEVRGYGPVKAAAAAKYCDEVKKRLAAFTRAQKFAKVEARTLGFS